MAAQAIEARATGGTRRRVGDGCELLRAQGRAWRSAGDGVAQASTSSVTARTPRASVSMRCSMVPRRRARAASWSARTEAYRSSGRTWPFRDGRSRPRSSCSRTGHVTTPFFVALRRRRAHSYCRDPECMGATVAGWRLVHRHRTDVGEAPGQINLATPVEGVATAVHAGSCTGYVDVPRCSTSACPVRRLWSPGRAAPAAAARVLRVCERPENGD